MEIPKEVASVLERLRQAGYEAYAVGGCVRDSLLGRTPKDWDVTTSALPGEIKAVFDRTIDTGIKHGTVTVMVNGTGIEVTTYRIDGEYLDGRHPEEVVFTSNLKEDLRRRDFTINAFVYNENEGIKDFFDGIDDLNNRIIRCVGEPEERFGEDALRILRAVRFSAVLGFSIEDSTYKAAVKLAGNLKKVSAERIKTEIDKILLSDNPDHIWVLVEMKIAFVIMPELEKVQDHDSLKKALKLSEKNLSTRWAILLHFIENGISKRDNNVAHFESEYVTDDDKKDDSFRVSVDILSRLKFDNKTADKVLLFFRIYDSLKLLGEIGNTENRVCCRRLLNLLGDGNVYDYLDYLNAVSLGAYEERIEQLRDDTAGVILRKECYSLKSLAVNGRDLLAENLAEGREVGELLDWLLEAVFLSPEKNDREYLLDIARSYKDGKI